MTNTILNKNYLTGILKTDISDHFPVFLISESAINKNEKNNFVYKRTITDINMNKFKESLAGVNWNGVLTYKDPNLAYNEFLKIFQTHYDIFFPKKKHIIKSKTLASPWITKGIMKSSKRKQKLYEKLLKRKTIKNEENYKNYKRLFESVKRRSKASYFKERLNKYKNDVKKTWDVIKEVIGNTKSMPQKLPKRLLVNNIEVFDKEQIAEQFNKYFTNVGPNLASMIPKTNKDFKSFLCGDYPLFNETPLADDEIKNAFISLKSNKSPGFDEISPNVIKFVVDILIEPIKHVFDLSLKNGIFPEQLKVARVTPIFKSGEKSLLSNYRPISVLPCFSKVLEKIMYNRLYSFLIENDVLYSKQFGFQKGRSTEHAILQLTNQILQSFNQDKFTIGVFIDLSKAFDTVDHSILLKKLSFYGVKNNNLKWFKSYLSNRKQFILTDQGNTEMKSIICGVPQGSILGPLLFLIFVNDLAQSTLLDPIMFADDTNLFFSNKNIKILFETVNRELLNINIWFQANKLSLNANKTRYVFFHKPKKKDDIPLRLPILRINNSEIKREQSIKFLGVIIDENLTWKNHIEILENKISKNVGVLFKASKLLNTRCLKNIYFALIHSYVNYANIAWASSNKTSLKNIYFKQKHAARLIFHKDRMSHSRPLMKKLNALNVYQINLYQTISFMYQVKSCTLPKIFNDNFSSVDHSYSTRFALNSFQLPRSSKTSRFSIAQRGPKLWNEFLTNDEKNCSSHFTFKQILKNKILEFDNELIYY